MKNAWIISLALCSAVLASDDIKESIQKEIAYEKYERLNELKDLPSPEVYVDRLKQTLKNEEFKAVLDQKVSSISEAKKQQVLAFAQEIYDTLSDLKESAQHASGKYAQLMDSTSKKTRKLLNNCIKNHQEELVAKLVKEWSSFHLTKEEKESLNYLGQYFKQATDTPKAAIDKKWKELTEAMLMKLSIITDEAMNYRPYNLKEWFYAFQLNLLEEMKNTLDQDFSPERYQHIESAMQALTKKLQHNYAYLQLFNLSNGKILPSTKLEKKVADIMKKYASKKEHAYEVLKQFKEEAREQFEKKKNAQKDITIIH